MIDWAAFLVVALTSILSAAAIVSLYAFGLRLLAGPGSARRAGSLRRVSAYGCFALAALGALFGLYLIVPAFHGG